MPSNQVSATQVATIKTTRPQLILQGFAFPVAVFFVHQVSVWMTDGKYWWDAPLHALGGMAIVWLLIHLHQAVVGLGSRSDLPRWYAMCWLVAGSAFVGIVWEWYEYLRWQTFDPTMDLTLADTLNDLLMDTLGAWVATMLFVPKQDTRR